MISSRRWLESSAYEIEFIGEVAVVASLGRSVRRFLEERAFDSLQLGSAFVLPDSLPHDLWRYSNPSGGRFIAKAGNLQAGVFQGCVEYFHLEFEDGDWPVDLSPIRTLDVSASETYLCSSLSDSVCHLRDDHGIQLKTRHAVLFLNQSGDPIALSLSGDR
ncbi:MAG: hypothetical protein RLP09_43300 [Sandaracinaceae bacterium]